MSPLQFATEILKINTWPKLSEIFEAVGSGERKVLVRSCNGAGKTTALAALCNWCLATYPDSIVLTTASSWGQVSRSLWGEIRSQARLAGLYEGVQIAQTQIKIDDKHYAIGISPERPENAQGFHAPRVFIAVDEATGVDREIIDALMGNLTGQDAQIVLICNPINMQSYPYEAEQSGEWKVVTISAFEHPNVISGNEEIKGAVTRTWIEDRLRSWSYEIAPTTSVQDAIYVEWLDKYYHKTPIAQSRILGEWADTESEGYIPMELIERSVKLESEGAASSVRLLGVDISRGVGLDATVYAFFDVSTDGSCDIQLPFESFNREDLMSTANRIKAHYDKCKADGIDLVIAIDDSGLGGGVSDRLKELGIQFHPVNFAQAAKGFLRNGKELANARAEMYFVLNQELREGSIKLLGDKAFHQELSSIRLDLNENSTAYKMEDKELTKRRLGRSPDYADATALARYALRLEAMKKKSKFF